jgi:hypothetical protein
LVFLKIHAPHKALLRHANIYNVQLTCQNPYYKYRERICNLLTTELTKPNPESEVYRRAEYVFFPLVGVIFAIFFAGRRSPGRDQFR